MKPLTVSLIGLGLAVEPHAQSLMALRHRVDVRWAVSRSQKRLDAFAAKYPFPVTHNVHMAIEDPDVDIVLLLTPPSTHLELGAMSLNAGKHLLVEKPLELHTDRAADLVKLAATADLRLGVVLQHRFRQASLRAAALIASGAIGSIEAASANVLWWRPQSYYDEPGRGTLARDGGGVLMTQAIHTIDLFRSLVGVKSVTAAQVATTSLHTMETEDFVSALVRLADGAPGQITATTAAYPGHAEEIQVLGSLGAITLCGNSLSYQGLDGTSEHLDTVNTTGAGADPMAFSYDAHQALIEDFLDAVEQERAPVVSGQEALISQSLIEAILEAGSRVATAMPSAGEIFLKHQG